MIHFTVIHLSLMHFTLKTKLRHCWVCVCVCVMLNIRPALQTAHDPEAFHAAQDKEGRRKRALGQGTLARVL